MKVKLLHVTPLDITDIAICKCYASKFEQGEPNVRRINNVANVNKHSSTIEHISYSFDIDGISRGCLQELARHRIASYTVKSSRYTLKELKKQPYFEGKNYPNAKKYIVMTGNVKVDNRSIEALNKLMEVIKAGVPNDMAKYCMPEAYKTSLVVTINARSLQNFFKLRMDKHAHWEIQRLAKTMHWLIPEDHKFLFENL